MDIALGLESTKLRHLFPFLYYFVRPALLVEVCLEHKLVPDAAFPSLDKQLKRIMLIFLPKGFCGYLKPSKNIFLFSYKNEVFGSLNLKEIICMLCWYCLLQILISHLLLATNMLEV